MKESFDKNYLSCIGVNQQKHLFSGFCKFKSVLRVPSVDVLIALVTSALVIAVTKFLKGRFR